MTAASRPVGGAVMARVRASSARQRAMATPGAELADVAGGRVVIASPIEPRLSQQDGFLHAGVVVAVLDGACGYAALTLMPDEAEVLTVELKVDLLAPARGDRLVAEGEVLRGGRTLTVCRGDALRRARARRDDAGDHGAKARADRRRCARDGGGGFDCRE